MNVQRIALMLLMLGGCRVAAPAEPPSTASTPATSPPPPTSVPTPAPAGLDLQSLYKTWAPSTVLVRSIQTTPNEEGGSSIEVNSGVGILLEDGRILTDCHVLRHDSTAGSPTYEVLISAGEPEPSGRVQRAKPAVPAKEIRCDAERDLALLRPLEPLELTRALRIADVDPDPGERAAALGASWKGFVWTIRDCVVAGIGSRREHGTPRLSNATPDQVDAFKRKVRRGTFIQASCADFPLSGSPLLSADGSVLGVLQFSSHDGTVELPQKSYFFIAASEIRVFLEE